ARALAGQLQYDSVDGASSSVKPSDQPDLPGEFDSAPGQNTKPEIERGERTADHGKGDGILLSPASTSFQALAGLDRPTLIAEQESDPSLRDLHKSEKEGVANKNIAFQTRSGVLYRQSGAKPSHSSRASAARREVNRQNAGALLDNSTISSKYPGIHECVLTSQLMFRREIKSGADAKSELSDCGFEKTLESGDQGFSGESGTENRLGIGRGLNFCREPPAARPRLSEERLLSAHPPDALPVGGGAVVPDRRQGAPSIRRVFPAPQVDEKERLVPDAVSSCNTWSQGKFLNRFVLHYEPLSYEPISSNPTQARRKRSLEQGHERVLLTFHAHSRSVDLFDEVHTSGRAEV
ncbi:hypothetical protein HPB47_018142, partial [Ixodes persulcatus]